MDDRRRSDRGNRDGGKPDWVFIAFVAFAVGTGLFVGTNRYRLRRAIERTSSCLALADATGAAQGLDDARAVASDDVRVRVLDADVQVLLGDTGKASAQLGSFDLGETGLEPEARGYLLLARGDLAATLGTYAQARTLYAAAQPFVKDTTLVQARLNRLSDAAQRQEAQWRALHDRIEDLFDAAEAGQVDTVSIRQRDLATQIAAIQDATAREKLTLAVSAAQRAAIFTKNASADPLAANQLSPPVAPGPVPGVDPRIHQAQLADYQRRLQAYQERQTKAEAIHDKRVAAQTAIASENLTQARQLLAEAMTALAAPGASKP